MVLITGFLSGLFPTPLYQLGRLFPTRLYHLHPCRRASMQAGLRRNDDGAMDTSTGFLGGLFQTPLYHLRSVGPAPE